MNTLEVYGAADVALAISAQLPENTTQTARTLYAVLVEVGLRVEERRGHVPGVTEAVLHLPLELVADAAGVSRVTAWRHLPALVELGVLDHRPHKATCRGAVRNSGTVWRVRLTPRRGARARVSADDLRFRWRGRDMGGAASYGVLKHTKTLEERSLKIECLTSWALSPGNQAPVTPVCFSPARPGLELLLDVTGARREDRRGAVDSAAQALSVALRDAASVNFYRLMMWGLLRRYDTTGQDSSQAVYLMAQRAAVDAREGFARRPGALFASRLKTAGLMGEPSGPPGRVASA